MNDLKVEGKVSDWCPKCKNCKGMTRESNGVHDWLTEVECKDPYDGMTKTLDADSDICCERFEPKPPCEKCERFDGTYCHGQNGNIYIALKTYGMGSVNCPLYEEKKEKEPHETKTAREIELEAKITALLSEQEKLEEELKKANELADSWKRDYERLRDQFVHPIYDILYPDIPNRDINVTDFINNVKDLKVYEDENKSMYEDLKYWRERCHGAETDVTTLNSKVEVLEKKLQKADSNRDAVWNESKLNQTISDQEVTIKALLITIKEMCKDE